MSKAQGKFDFSVYHPFKKVNKVITMKIARETVMVLNKQNEADLSVNFNCSSIASKTACPVIRIIVNIVL